MKKNNVELSEEELIVMHTSLHIVLMGYEQQVEANGIDSLSQETKQAIKGVRALYNRFEKEFF